MKVLHVIPSYLPARRYGGPMFAVHGLCRALRRRGHDVEVFTTTVDGDGEVALPADRPVALDGVTVRYFRCGFPRRVYWSRTLTAALAAATASFDVVHLHSVFLWPTSAAAREARRRGVPYVLAPRGMLDPSLLTQRSRVAKRVWIAALERRNCEGAAAIHATTELEARQLRSLPFRWPAIHVLPNGVEPPEPAPAAEWPLPAERGRRLLFLGRVSWKKGLDRLVPALRAAPDATLVVAGNDDEGLTPRLVELARTAGVADRVRFVGPAYGPDRTALFRAADLLVLPSRSENFANVVLEALAAGLPVAVSAAVGLAEVLQAEGAGLVVPDDPQALGAALADALARPDARRAAAAQGAELVRRRFGWDAVAAQAEELYAQVRPPLPAGARP